MQKDDDQWSDMLTLYNHAYQFALEESNDTIIEGIDNLITNKLSKMKYNDVNEEIGAINLITLLTDNDSKYCEAYIEICVSYHNFVDLPPSIDMLEEMIKKYREPMKTLKIQNK